MCWRGGAKGEVMEEVRQDQSLRADDGAKGRGWGQAKWSWDQAWGPGTQSAQEPPLGLDVREKE